MYRVGGTFEETELIFPLQHPNLFLDTATKLAQNFPLTEINIPDTYTHLYWIIPFQLMNRRCVTVCVSDDNIRNCRSMASGDTHR